MNAYRLKPLSFPWPPVLYGLAILFALLADRFIGILPSVMPNGYLFYAIGALLVAVALFLDLWAIKTLVEYRTTVMPHRGAQRLVTSGPFRYSRNPIYLGYTLITLAIGFLTGNAWFFVAAIGAAIVTTVIAIRKEEMHLLARFGIDFEHYCQRTRRWL
ncbi:MULTISPECIES: methyltransferase family protein [Ciceribacter]|uniref:Steroid 5-alpha reductase C-terminal domain-containing protein n=1 Tax=Ciceribacter selenitireducens ATCC BAA-1503 TaxID=1336235 RepID=A0A376AHT1_9HYPH|nr:MULTISPECIES: isoprenylcysteine carboxylmethyltransferase family protein [Ciceribacter]MCA1971152.1 isoprenylcysteine carboxylmethyltransferase family protein [Rhizobium sp.]SSC67348.1 unnamed protein product [Ciceribacter selenitireducens ATCC BAA-1503]SSC69770.1 unnamed protein product [Ciceribacter naphthalenivorans]